jgi:O-methyltransferase involved in polyketide biosynthesis
MVDANVRWHRPVLEILAAGPGQAAEIIRALPGMTRGQLDTALRELAGLGWVQEGAAWELTSSGRSTLVDLRYLDRLGAGLFNTSAPHPARRYNYWLGGEDNFSADRRSADEIERLVPGMRAGVRANRDVLRRVVRHLAASEGVRQFLDIGTGLPTADNTHEVAQSIAPDCRVVYVDNDPLVLAHARALLAGRTAYIEADLREPYEILRAPEVLGTLDLSRPVALMLVGVLHFVPGDGEAKLLVDRLMGALAPGSFLFVTHVTNDFLPAATIAEHEEMQRSGRSDFWMRPRSEVEALFDGLELLSPGVVPTTKWRPDPDTPDLALSVVNAWAGVGRKGPAPVS